jgi:hypothetical protein
MKDARTHVVSTRVQSREVRSLTAGLPTSMTFVAN